MLSDYFTKPLQGSLFCSVLLSELLTSTLSAPSPASGNEERVDNHEPEPLGKDQADPSQNCLRDGLHRLTDPLVCVVAS
jgi:hypothetical protein